MRVLLAPASFKGSLSAFEAADAMAAGVRDALPDAAVDLCPIGDGGEGTAEILARSCPRFEERWTRTVDPLGRPIDARWFLVREAHAGMHLLAHGCAILDAASCLGITLVAPEELDAMRASSAGLGVMLGAVVDEGVDRIVVGLGGTATMDAGVGMGAALGWTFGEGVPGCAGSLGAVRTSAPPSGRLGVEITALCDVDAPLTGPRGAPRVFGPQKGATPAQVEFLDRAFASFAEIVGRGDPGAPGAGAAGGLGWGLAAFAGAALKSGADAVLDAIGFDARARAAGIVLTGEGRVDAQTAMGKAVARACARACGGAGTGTARVGVIAGRVEGDSQRALGVHAVAALSAGDGDDAIAMREARVRVRAATARVIRELVGFRSGSC